MSRAMSLRHPYNIRMFTGKELKTLRQLEQTDSILIFLEVFSPCEVVLAILLQK